MSDIPTEIELDALRALSGAEEVRKKVLACMSMGSPSIDMLAYLIKCRIKAHDRLVEKVMDRRKKKPAYKASDATDIVGLRILALYRAELPIIIRHFLALTKFASEEPINLFAGSDLRDSLKEVIIYRASPVGDVVDQLIVTEFERQGLTCKIVPDDANPDEIDAHVRIVRKPTEYSSIHLVFWCYGFTKDKRYTVPLEVQVRTVIEDVWGEIDHSLNYKISDGNPDALNDDQKRHHGNAMDGLKILKRLLDNCTQQADLIHNQMQNIFGTARQELKPSLAERSVDTQKLLDLKIGGNIRKKLAAVVTVIRQCFEHIYADAWPRNSKEVTSAIESFNGAAKELDECFLAYEKSRSADQNIDRDVNYYLRMERCLCLYWVAYLTKIILDDKLRENLMGPADKALEESLNEYFQLEKDPRFVSDPILPFRIGNALRLRGYSEIAFDKFEEAYSKLSGLSVAEFDPAHHMRIRIPRAFSVMLWEQAEILRRDAIKLRNPDLSKETRLLLYLRAIDVSRSLDGFQATLLATDERIESANDDRVTVNNVVDYTLSYLRAGGSWTELEARGITKDSLSAYVDILVGDGLDTIKMATLADTVRAAANFYGNDDLVRRAAERVLNLMSRPNFSSGISQESFAEMRADAEMDLQRLSPKIPP